MAKTKAGLKVYTVVDVMCGVAVDAKNFLDISDARKCLRQLRKDRNLDEDDVQLFETRIRWHPKLPPVEDE